MAIGTVDLMDLRVFIVKQFALGLMMPIELQLDLLSNFIYLMILSGSLKMRFGHLVVMNFKCSCLLLKLIF